jgi:spore maturation protein CgeB
MKITVFGSSLTSAYWNGAATYYRGICKALHRVGHQITFVEQDIYWRQAHRDLAEDPDYAAVRICAGVEDLRRELRAAASADLVAVCSGLGANEEMVERGVLELAGADCLVAYWDVDAPATLERLRDEPGWYFRELIPRFDMVLTYGGGPPVAAGYAEWGAREVVPVYNAVDPEEYEPVAPDSQLAYDLLFVGHRMPDREERFRMLFLDVAEAVPEARLCLGGEGWGNETLPANVTYLGFVPTARHTALYCSARLCLNINRGAMARYGYSPPTRVFEVTGCGGCLVVDDWVGLDTFFVPGEEVLVARDAAGVARLLRTVSWEEARAIGRRGRARALRDHTYESRVRLLDGYLRRVLSAEC